MKQREVTDTDNTTWTCVEAYSGMQEKLAEKAAQLADNKEGIVTVVCTPSGGAKTVRLDLPQNWLDEMKDEVLIDLIVQEKD